MKQYSAALILTVALHASRWHNVAAQPSCAPIGVGDGPKVLEMIKESLVSPAPDATKYRQAFGLVGVDSGSVVAVSDTLVCSAVTLAIDTQFRTPVRTGPFFVARLGPRYVAFEPDAKPQPMFYVDTNFVFVAGTP